MYPDNPEASKQIGCIIMASGFSRRFGSNKLLVPFSGKPLISYILQATDLLFDIRLVVTRYLEIAKLADESGARVVLHQEKELRDTIRIGLREIKDTTNCCMFCQADQPLLQKSSLSAMIQAWQAEPGFIYRAAFGNQQASPILFPSWAYDELLNLPPNGSGRNVLKQHPDQIRLIQVSFPEELTDTDTPETLQMLLNTK